LKGALIFAAVLCQESRHFARKTGEKGEMAGHSKMFQRKGDGSNHGRRFSKSLLKKKNLANFMGGKKARSPESTGTSSPILAQQLALTPEQLVPEDIVATTIDNEANVAERNPRKPKRLSLMTSKKRNKILNPLKCVDRTAVKAYLIAQKRVSDEEEVNYAIKHIATKAIRVNQHLNTSTRTAELAKSKAAQDLKESYLHHCISPDDKERALSVLTSMFTHNQLNTHLFTKPDEKVINNVPTH
jgi:hypothetical protein